MAEKKRAKLAHDKISVTSLLCPECKEGTLVYTRVWPKAMWLVCDKCNHRRRVREGSN